MNDVVNYIGVDYSMTSPAVVVKTPSGVFAYAFANKKSQGIFSSGNWNIIITDYPQYTSQEERFNILGNFVCNIVKQTEGVSRVRIEGYSYGSSGKIFNLAENCGVLKHILYMNGVTFDTLAPTSVKKYACGKGNADKQMMYDSFEEKMKLNLKSLIGDGKKGIGNPLSDIVDAYFLASSIEDGIEPN